MSMDLLLVFTGATGNELATARAVEVRETKTQSIVDGVHVTILSGRPTIRFPYPEARFAKDTGALIGGKGSGWYVRLPQAPETAG